MALVGQQGRVRSHGDSLAAIAVTTEMPDCRLTIFPRPGTLHFYGEVADRRAAGIGGAFEIGARLGAQLVLLQLFVDRRENSAQVPNTGRHRSEEHTSELQSLMRISYAVFCLK